MDSSSFINHRPRVDATSTISSRGYYDPPPMFTRIAGGSHVL
ncbi:MAG: hypothetical protein ACTSUE_18880 [Promethearchaeota archaeon]